MILKEFTIEEIFDKLPDVSLGWGINSVYIEYELYNINITSKRNKHKYKLFKINRCCTFCKSNGVKFLLEWNDNFTEINVPELNLYTENNIKMTVDHIIPKVFGGTNDFYNLQTMCELCNNKKDKNIVSIMPNVMRLSSKKTVPKEFIDLFGNKLIIEKR